MNIRHKVAKTSKRDGRSQMLGSVRAGFLRFDELALQESLSQEPL